MLHCSIHLVGAIDLEYTYGSAMQDNERTTHRPKFRSFFVRNFSGKIGARTVMFANDDLWPPKSVSKLSDPISCGRLVSAHITDEIEFGRAVSWG